MKFIALFSFSQTLFIWNYLQHWFWQHRTFQLISSHFSIYFDGLCISTTQSSIFAFWPTNLYSITQLFFSLMQGHLQKMITGSLEFKLRQRCSLFFQIIVSCFHFFCHLFLCSPSLSRLLALYLFSFAFLIVSSFHQKLLYYLRFNLLPQLFA